MFKMINYSQDEDKFYHDKYYDREYMKNYENKLFKYRTIPKEYLFKLSVSACHKLYLTSFIKDIGATIPINIINEDNPFFYKILFEANRYYLIDEYYYNRRRRINSITTQNNTFMITSIKTAELILKVLLDNGLYDEYKKYVLNKVIFMIRLNYEKISDEFKEKFYNKCVDFINNVLTPELYTDSFELIEPEHKIFLNKLIYSSDYEDFNNSYSL